MAGLLRVHNHLSRPYMLLCSKFVQFGLVDPHYWPPYWRIWRSHTQLSILRGFTFSLVDLSQIIALYLLNLGGNIDKIVKLGFDHIARGLSYQNHDSWKRITRKQEQYKKFIFLDYIWKYPIFLPKNLMKLESWLIILSLTAVSSPSTLASQVSTTTDRFSEYSSWWPQQS